MAVRGLHHVFFWTRDLDASLTFYREVLGLAVLRREGDSWAELDAGPIRLGLHGRTDDEPVYPGGTVVFEVDSLDEARWSLEQRGVAFDETAGEVEGYARFAAFRDPDGNLLQLIEYRRPSPEPDA